MIHDVSLQASATLAVSGILSIVGPAVTKKLISGPREVHESNQKLAVLPLPIVHFINLWARGRRRSKHFQVQASFCFSTKLQSLLWRGYCGECAKQPKESHYWRIVAR